MFFNFEKCPSNEYILRIITKTKYSVKNIKWYDDSDEKEKPIPNFFMYNAYKQIWKVYTTMWPSIWTLSCTQKL